MVPSQDTDGNLWRMDVFHALYFVGFMATTIGFGEIPHAFSDPQRLWVLFSIYATVVVWVYAIGTLLALLQDRAFRQALTERHFAQQIRRLRERFFLVCGYGETGRVLVHALTERDRRGAHVRLEHLLRDPRDCSRPLPCTPLLLARNGNLEVLPALDWELDPDDRLLFCGVARARVRMECALQNIQGPNYIMTGASQPQGTLWRFIRSRLRKMGG